MFLDPVSLLAVHHSQHQELVGEIRSRGRQRVLGLSRRLHGVSVLMLRYAYVRVRASYVASGRTA